MVVKIVIIFLPLSKIKIGQMNIIRHIPNSITSLNLLSGSIAVILSFYGEFTIAFYCIIAAAIFDFFDGFAARLLKAYSPIGKELDSLADVISFGLAPTMILFNKLLVIFGLEFTQIFTLGFSEARKYLIPLFCALLIAVFSALRLAKFNIDTRQTENFLGLATPSCALIVASMVSAMESYPAIESFIVEHTFLLPVLAVILSGLIVSEIPMFSFKFKSFSWADNKLKFSFIGGIIALAIIESILLGGFSLAIWIFSVLVFYILLNVGLSFTTRK